MINNKGQLVLSTIDEALHFIQSVTEIDQEDIEAVAFLINDTYPTLGQKDPPPKNMVRYFIQTGDKAFAIAKKKDAERQGIYVEFRKLFSNYFVIQAYPFSDKDKDFLIKGHWKLFKEKV